MAAANYQDLAGYIKDQNPYRPDIGFPDTLGPNGGQGVLTVQFGGPGAWSLYWDFREPLDGNVGNLEFKALDVVNYPIIRAVVVPYVYKWTQDHPVGAPDELIANILIGYTPVRDALPTSPTQTFVDAASPANTNGAYGALGEIIERRQPLSPQTELLSQPLGGTLTDITTAVSWLANNNSIPQPAGAPPKTFQKSNPLMTREERQQCLYWDGPRRVSTPFGPMAATGDPHRVANYQITKAFRIGYTFLSQGQTLTADILVGYNGGGDAA